MGTAGLTFFRGRILFRNGKIALNTDCCCGRSSSSSSSRSRGRDSSSSFPSMSQSSIYRFGNISIPIFTDMITITGLSLNCIPESIKIDISKPTENSEIVKGNVLYNTVSNDGFSVQLLQQVPSSGYVLSFMITKGDCIKILGSASNLQRRFSSRSSSSSSNSLNGEQSMIIDRETLVKDFFDGKNLLKIVGLKELYDSFVQETVIKDEPCNDCKLKRIKREYIIKIHELLDRNKK